MTGEVTEIVGEAASGGAAIDAAGALLPDVVVMDLHLPDLSGIQATRHIAAVSPDTGVLMLTPLMLAASQFRLARGIDPLRVLEAFALFVGGFLVALFATTYSVNLLFLVFPLLVWSAIRFQLVGAMPCALIASIVVAFAASRDHPAFVGIDLAVKMVVLQAFNGSIALTALLLATITAQRNHARQALDDACAQLAEAITILGRSVGANIGIPDPLGFRIEP